MTIDLRTDFQKMTAARAERVCDLYKQLKEGDAGSDTAIWKYISEQVSKEFSKPISIIGVRNILIRKELYEPSK